MKFVTFNIRTSGGHDGLNRFECRAKLILDKINAEKPDVIGFQECKPDQFDFLREYLLDYTVAGSGRGADYESEHNPIAFNKHKYELLSLETQWLSPTPNVPGSRYAIQSDCPRIVTVATLRPYGTAKPFRVFNTHLDHVSDEAREQGAEHIVCLMNVYRDRMDLPMVLMGDFNAFPGSKPLGIFLNAGLTEHTGNIPNSYHGYGACPEHPRIDYIMSTGFAQIGDAYAWKDCRDGLYLSDHYPVCAELEQENV